MRTSSHQDLIFSWFSGQPVYVPENRKNSKSGE
nr:MAG TPA: hypothetical protein [Caudoviricetes sp.]